MKYTTAKALAREFFSLEPAQQVFEGPDELELTVRIATSGEVELRLAVELLYERKRNHTSLRCSPYLYTSRLRTYPDDSSFLHTMPRTDDDFIVSLLLASTAALELATLALPAETAEELLEWAREEAANAKFPLLAHQSHGWSVLAT